MQKSSIALIFLSLISTGWGCLSGDPSNPFGTTTPASTAITQTPGGETTAGSNTDSPTSPSSGGDNCKAAACNFGKGNPCNYENTGEKKFENRKGRVGNRDTGVTGPALGSENYMGTEINPGEKAVLQSSPVNFDTDKSLQVRYFEATDGLVLKACSNDESNCSPLSNPGIKVTDKTWATNTWPIPKGTNKILLVGQNDGTNKGALGIDKVDIVDGTVKPGGIAGLGQCGL